MSYRLLQWFPVAKSYQHFLCQFPPNSLGHPGKLEDDELELLEDDDEELRLELLELSEDEDELSELEELKLLDEELRLELELLKLDELLDELRLDEDEELKELDELELIDDDDEL